MADPKLIATLEIDPDEIDASGRERPPSEAGVEVVMASIQELGIVKDEAYVRRIKRTGKYRLMAGGHRLEACRRLGRPLPCKVYECTDDWAALIELDDNLARADLSALDTAVFLARRKDVYERIHPEARRGFAGGKARHGQLTDIESVSSFAAATAEKFGLTDRHVRRLIAAGEALHADEVQVLRNAPSGVTLADLQAIGKIGEQDERSHVVAALGEGRVKNATAARGEWKALKNGAPPPLKDPVEAALKSLKTAWQRAPKEARMRFVRENAAGIRHVLGEIGRDA